MFLYSNCNPIKGSQGDLSAQLFNLLAFQLLACALARPVEATPTNQIMSLLNPSGPLGGQSADEPAQQELLAARRITKDQRTDCGPDKTGELARRTCSAFAVALVGQLLLRYPQMRARRAEAEATRRLDSLLARAENWRTNRSRSAIDGHAVRQYSGFRPHPRRRLPHVAQHSVSLRRVALRRSLSEPLDTIVSCNCVVLFDLLIRASGDRSSRATGPAGRAAPASR